MIIDNELIKTKLGEQLFFTVQVDTPFDPLLTIYNTDGSIFLGPLLPVLERLGYFYYQIDINTLNGFTASKTWFKVVIEDGFMTGFVPVEYFFYITDEKNFEDILARCSGLAGNNIRKYQYVWANGQMQSYHLKLYASNAAVDAAEAGTSDNFIAHYLIEAKYNSEYNRYEITGKKQ